MSQLLTIGYEGRTLDGLILDLKDRGVEFLIDIRWTPISRKPGFSKGALARALEVSGIRYVHYQVLGAPKELRTELYSAGRYEEFFAGYRKHLSENMTALHEIVNLATASTTCLLCFERQPHMCHRHVVAQEAYEISDGHLRVNHL